MKTLITITLAALLTACGCGVEESPVTVKVDAPLLVEPTLQMPAATPEPVLTVCPQSNGCEPAPVALPARKVTTVDDTQPVCVRDSTPLVMIDGVLTDNCGNKYGNVVK